MKYLILLILLSGCIFPDNPNPGQVIEHDAVEEGHKVCVIGDSGNDSPGQRLVANALMEEGCDQVRHTGDIIYGEGIDSADDPEFEKRFANYYSEMYENGIPFFMTQGNHDYKKKPDAWLEVARRHEGIHFPSMYYMDIYEDICFLMIDTNAFPIEQYRWRKKLKRDYKHRCKLTLAFGHHPRYSAGKHGSATLFIRTFLNKTIKGRVDAYFAGHEHNQEDYGVKKGTHFFVSGGAGSYRFIKRKPRVWAQAKLGYQVFTIHYEDNQPFLKYTFYSVDENTGEKTIEHTGETHGVGFR